MKMEIKRQELKQKIATANKKKQRTQLEKANNIQTTTTFSSSSSFYENEQIITIKAIYFCIK